MDPNQESRENPFGMDTACRRCPALCDARERVVHGYGDVSADALFVGTAPDAGADETGVPFAGRRRLYAALSELGLCPDPGAERPAVENVFLTHLTRCHHPERGPTDEEVRECDDYLTAEVRTINPTVLVPVGERALRAVVAEHTTADAETFSLPTDNGRTVRGRGFEVVPAVDPAEYPDRLDAVVAGVREAGGVQTDHSREH